MPINLTPQLNAAIPGFSRNTTKASNIISELLAGKLTAGERGAIYNAGAERGTASGMPGSTGSGGSLFANADLRNIGLASGERQQQGIQDLLSMLTSYSGTVLPTTGQELQNQQFGQEMDFRRTNADRDYKLRKDEADINMMGLLKRYGPKEYSKSITPRLGGWLGPGSSGTPTTIYKYFS